ncbi:hypothetical protein K1719_023399 [Acacia pycnantha]|nr:hypothetical protein K1719_023399 [Acacia pycnantha]
MFHSIRSFTAFTIGSEPDELPFSTRKCTLCCFVPSWHCWSLVALCAFLVEAGPVHHTQSTRSFGSLSGVCGTHKSFLSFASSSAKLKSA